MVQSSIAWNIVRRWLKQNFKPSREFKIFSNLIDPHGLSSKLEAIKIVTAVEVVTAPPVELVFRTHLATHPDILVPPSNFLNHLFLPDNHQHPMVVLNGWHLLE
jgi:hypothetical protein